MAEFKNFEELAKLIKKGDYHNVYILHGVEAYYIDELTKLLDNQVLTEDQKAFNHTVVYGKDSDSKHIIDCLRRYPTFAPYQFVLVKEAQELKTIDGLKDYFKNPVPTSILVLAHKHKSLDKRKSWVKEVTKSDKIAVLETKKLYDNQVGTWIRDYLGHRQYKADPKALDMLVQYLGNDLSKVANELDKLMINIPPSVTLMASHIQENIGISKEYNVFELQTALAMKNQAKAVAIVRNFVANPKDNALPMITGAFYNFFSKVYVMCFCRGMGDGDLAKAAGVSPFMIKDYKTALQNYKRGSLEQVISTIRDYDLRSKGIALDYKDDLLFSESTPYEGLLLELVYRIISA
jgi:DNA polymerase-3 subunit delta